GPLGVSLTPTNGAAFNFGQAISLSAAPGGGTPPYSATFYTNGQVVGIASVEPFSVGLGLLEPGTYNAYVHVADSSTPTAQQSDSAVSTLSILPNPMVINLTSPTNGQSGFPGSALALAAAAI